ncbi:MAG: spore coat U domain-containing protein [Cupriavidus sp.]|nr:spore coat U domain-containing protein [Cupriavidus sp.]
MDFGNVDLVNGGPYTGTATLTYSCENDTNQWQYMRLCFNIGDGSASIDSGGNRWNPRILRIPAGNEMNFQLYQGSTGNIWGSTTQVISDAYDVVVKMPPRLGRNTPSVTPGTYNMRGVIGPGQAALPGGRYTSNFGGNHTAFRYTAAFDSENAPGSCNSATNNGPAFGFNVYANVYKSCVVSADPLDFGTVNGIPSSTNIDSQTTIRVNCTAATAYRVLLVMSSNSPTGESNMKGVTAGNPDTVPYKLYQNAGRNQPWGNQTDNTPTGTGTGANQELKVYGRVPGLPNVRPDDYRDTVTVNVTY